MSQDSLFLMGEFLSKMSSNTLCELKSIVNSQIKKDRTLLFFIGIFSIGVLQVFSGAIVFPGISGDQNFSLEDCNDSDDDGVCNSADKCLNSRKGERVDKDGCDPFQFCEKFNCGAFCAKADFLGNELYKLFPGDCTTVIIAKEGKYFPKCVPLQCEKQLNIPNVYVNFSITKGKDSFLNVTLWDVPEGYDVYDETWMGWCGDKNETIQNKKRYEGILYSSYDPDLETKCPACYNTNWTKINYIINNKEGTKEDVQHAIWYFTDGKYPHHSKPLARKMVEDAKLYGEDFWPQSGQFMAIIIYVRGEVQLVFIEVDP